MTDDVTANRKVGRLRVSRSRGAVGGVLLLIGGLWAGLVPFIGPYGNLAYTPSVNDAWKWTAARGWLEVLPGGVAVLGGLLLISATDRITASLGGWLGVAAGGWLVVGPALADPLGLDLGTPDPNQSSGIRAIEAIVFFYGIGAAIVLVAGLALGRLSVHSVRDVEFAERRAAAEAERQAEEARLADEHRRFVDEQAERERQAQRDRQAAAASGAAGGAAGGVAGAGAAGGGRSDVWGDQPVRDDATTTPTSTGGTGGAIHGRPDDEPVRHDHEAAAAAAGAGAAALASARHGSDERDDRRDRRDHEAFAAPVGSRDTNDAYDAPTRDHDAVAAPVGDRDSFAAPGDSATTPPRDRDPYSAPPQGDDTGDVWPPAGGRDTDGLGRATVQAPPQSSETRDVWPPAGGRDDDGPGRNAGHAPPQDNDTRDVWPPADGRDDDGPGRDTDHAPQHDRDPYSAPPQNNDPYSTPPPRDHDTSDPYSAPPQGNGGGGPYAAPLPSDGPGAGHDPYRPPADAPTQEPPTSSGLRPDVWPTQRSDAASNGPVTDTRTEHQRRADERFAAERARIAEEHRRSQAGESNELREPGPDDALGGPADPQEPSQTAPDSRPNQGDYPPFYGNRS